MRTRLHGFKAINVVINFFLAWAGIFHP